MKKNTGKYTNIYRIIGWNGNLKNTNPLKWTGLMNNCKYLGEEIIFRELIYNLNFTWHLRTTVL